MMCICRRGAAAGTMIECYAEKRHSNPAQNIIFFVLEKLAVVMTKATEEQKIKKRLDILNANDIKCVRPCVCVCGLDEERLWWHSHITFNI